MNNKYSKKVMEHFLNPQNVGEIKNPSGRGRIGNSVCGDIMEMTIKVSKQPTVSRSGIRPRQTANPAKRDLAPPDSKQLVAESRKLEAIIIDAKFQTFGCGAAVATSSIVTEMVKGQTIAQAKKLTPEKVDKSLGNLPVMKKHCARLAINALHKAIENYEKKS